MALTDYVLRERLPELWRQIDNTHFSYLETDDSPEKLDQKKKLEGYILDYLCLVPHENKFFLAETGAVLSRSVNAPGCSGYRLARGWAALARYAANLLAQPWRKEYRTIRLYSGFYKHSVEGAGLVGAEALLRSMGYCDESCGDGTALSLDGPVCPDRVAAVSRDSLIAYVECQIMTQVWEEVSLRGGACSWLEVFRCREVCSGDASSAAVALMHPHTSQNNDIYCNVKYPNASSELSLKQGLLQQAQNNHIVQLNGHAPHPAMHAPHSVMHMPNGSIVHQNGHAKTHIIPVVQEMQQPTYCQNMPNQMHMPTNTMHRPMEMNGMYGYNTIPVMNHYGGVPGYYYNPVPQHPYMMQQPMPQYGTNIRQVNNMPITNGYHCPTVPVQQTYCPTVPTGQLIELDVQPSYGTNARSNNHHHYPNATSPKQGHGTVEKSKDGHIKVHHVSNYESKSNSMNRKIQDVNGENQENIRRNSAPRSSVVHPPEPSHHVLPRSDTQPSLSKAREDGMGTFESWDYVFRNLESQGYSKDLGERGNILSPPLDRDSKTLGRIGPTNSKRYQQTTMDLEDALHAMSLEKNSDEEVYRTAKINETLQKIKQETDAKVAKAHFKRQILADEREKRKSSSYDNASVSPSRDAILNLSTDKTRLISKEDSKDKKEMDKSVYVNGNGLKAADPRKVRKSIVKCLSSDADKVNRRKISTDNSTQPTAAPKKTHTTQVAVVANNPVPPPAVQPPISADCTDQGLKTRLVVTLQDSEPPQQQLQQQQQPKQHHQQNNPQPQRWECGTCTFLNGPGRKACEMCGKSKRVGVEALPLASGGRECPACTLVNPRGAAACGACDTSLRHSPTYI